jgi:deoxyxylulose-5-phosphate synthase
VHEDINLLVVLNDNDMSISPPVGALNRYLARLMSGKFYAAARNVGKSVLPSPVLELAKRFEEHAKGMLVPATMFEEFGFNYIGPIDGHDLESLIPTLQNIRQLKGPQFLHVVTKKVRDINWRKPILCCITALANLIQPKGSNQARPRNKPTPRFSGNGCAIWQPATRNW